MSVTTC